MKNILALLLAPIVGLSNLSRHKNNLIEWCWKYSTNPSGRMGDCYLEIKTSREVDDNLLVASFILFLARYFLIADDRQKGTVAGVLNDSVTRSDENPLLPFLLYTEVTKHAVSETEREAIVSTFSSGYNLPTAPFGLPPLDYKVEVYRGRTLAKYDFYISEASGHLYDWFYMSLGYDIILLPVTLGMMYKVVTDKLSPKGRKLLSKCILGFLDECQTTRGALELNSLANRVLAENQTNPIG